MRGALARPDPPSTLRDTRQKAKPFGDLSSVAILDTQPDQDYGTVEVGGYIRFKCLYLRSEYKAKVSNQS